MSTVKTRHAFGSKDRVDSALEAGTIDAYDIVLMEGENYEGEIGWINKTGHLVSVPIPNNVKVVTELPDEGETEVLYICGTKLYYWSGTEFTTLVNPEATSTQIETVAEEVAQQAAQNAIESALEAIDF